MIDRYGNSIAVGWMRRDLIWIEAALALPCKMRAPAFRDIAEMSGRTFEEVRSRAYARTKEAKAANKTFPRRLTSIPLPKLYTPSSFISPPSKAQLMGRR